MGQSTSEALISRALKTGILNVSGQNYKTIPDTFCQLKSTLRSVDLSNNRIQKIPDFINKFSNLSIFIIFSNCIKQLPETINQCSALKKLDVSKNLLITIPSTLGSLCSLTILNVSENRLTEIPQCLFELPKLTILNISKNNIKNLDLNFEYFSGVEFDCRHNRIEILPKNIHRCETIRILRFSHNKLTLDKIDSRIFSDSNLIQIDYDHNEFLEDQIRQCHGYEEVLY
ncbi:hypothetical protein HZS_983, partial [Henneguya salminicola]